MHQPDGLQPGWLACSCSTGGSSARRSRAKLIDAPPDADLRSRVIDVVTGEEILDLKERVRRWSEFNPEGRFAAGRYLAVTVQTDVGVVEIYDIASASWSQPRTADPSRRRGSTRRDDGCSVWWGRKRVGARPRRRVDGATVDEALVFERIISNGGQSGSSLQSTGCWRPRARATGSCDSGISRRASCLLEFRTDRIDGLTSATAG